MSYDATCSDIIYTWCWYNLCLCCFVRHKTCVSQAVGNRLHGCMQFSSMLYKMWCIMWGRTSEKRNRNNTLHNRSSTIETAHNTKSFYTHPLPFRSVAGVRNLHRCSHLACYRCSSLLARFIFQHQPTYSQLVAYHGGHSRLHRMQRGNPERGSCWWQVFVMPGEG